MSSRDFRELLAGQCARRKYVCVGLDSRFTDLPRSIVQAYDGRPATHPQFVFNAANVTATSDRAGVYKANIHFYLSQGPAGYQALLDTVRYINRIAPEVPFILDYKTGDIGNTNDEIAATAYDIVGADAATYHGYTGRQAMLPILGRREKGAIILSRTSNEGAGEFQDMEVLPAGQNAHRDSMPQWRRVADNIAALWDEFGNCGLVFGATYPAELKAGRELVGDMPLLLPGVGAQGGDVLETVRAGISRPGHLATINSSRGIIFAYDKEEAAAVSPQQALTIVAEAARQATLRLNEQILQALAL